MAFANTVEEAAVLTRCFGDIAEAADADATAGALWGDRAWLEDEYIEVSRVSRVFNLKGMF